MPATTETENLSAQAEWTVIAVTNIKHSNSLPPPRMRATAAAARSNQIAAVGDHHHQPHLEPRGSKDYLPPPAPRIRTTGVRTN